MRNIEIVEQLLDKGAKVSAVDKVPLSSNGDVVIKLCVWWRNMGVYFPLFSFTERRHSASHCHPRA